MSCIVDRMQVHAFFKCLHRKKPVCNKCGGDPLALIAGWFKGDGCIITADIVILILGDLLSQQWELYPFT